MTEGKFKLDTRETAQEEQAGKCFLAQAKSRTDSFLAKWEAADIKVAPTSAIAKVDLLLPYHPLSYQIRSFIAVGLDNVRAAHLYIEKTNEIPMTALYSMIRSTVEATSYGLWILKAGKKEKQAFLSLRLTFENNEDLEGLVKVLKPSEWKDCDKVQKRLLELQQGINSYKNHDITQRATTTDVVREADKILDGKRKLFNGLQTWKACSGVAHANSAVLNSVLERQPTGEGDAIGQTFILTSRITFIAGFLLAAIENLEALLEMYEAACAMPPDPRRG